MNSRLRFKLRLRSHLLCILILALPLVGCSMKLQEGRGGFDFSREPSAHNGRLNLFLTMADKPGPATQVEIMKLEILSGDLWLPLIDSPVLLDSQKIGVGQVFLAGTEVPPGQYDRLRMTVSKASVLKSDSQPEEIIAAEKTVELTLARPVNLAKGDSKVLHFTWVVESALAPGDYLSSAFVVLPTLRQLSADIIFVSCPETNTIFVVRTDKNWVVDSFGVPGAPSWIAVDPGSSAQRLYVLAPKEKQIKIIDVSSQRVVKFYPTLNEEATYLTISPDGDNAYLLHEKSGYVSRMDLRTGQVLARVMLGSRPAFATYLEDRQLLAVSLKFADRVVLLDPRSLKLVATMATGRKPDGLCVVDDILYVAESGEASVTSIELANVNHLSRFLVGFGPRRIVAADNQLMVANYHNGSLSILFPGQLGALQEIHGLDSPLEMIFDPSYRRLYVADVGKSALAIVDTNTNQLVGHLFLGARPLGLARGQ